MVLKKAVCRCQNCNGDALCVPFARRCRPSVPIYRATTGKKGRPKKYTRKVDIGNIDKEYFAPVDQTDELTLYSAVVYSKSLKRNIRLAYVVYVYQMGNGKQTIKLCYSTDVELCPKDILLITKAASRSSSSTVMANSLPAFAMHRQEGKTNRTFTSIPL
jgi:hypothetical protein